MLSTRGFENLTLTDSDSGIACFRLSFYPRHMARVRCVIIEEIYRVSSVVRAHFFKGSAGGKGVWIFNMWVCGSHVVLRICGDGEPFTLLLALSRADSRRRGVVTFHRFFACG